MLQDERVSLSIKSSWRTSSSERRWKTKNVNLAHVVPKQEKRDWSSRNSNWILNGWLVWRYRTCNIKRGWDKVPSLSVFFGLSSKTQWLSGLYYAGFINFTALLNCAEVGRQSNSTNYRFLSHSLFTQPNSQRIWYTITVATLSVMDIT